SNRPRSRSSAEFGRFETAQISRGSGIPTQECGEHPGSDLCRSGRCRRSLGGRSQSDIETIVGEYIPLLHIACSVSEDSGAGNLVENIVVSERIVQFSCAHVPKIQVKTSDCERLTACERDHSEPASGCAHRRSGKPGASCWIVKFRRTQVRGIRIIGNTVDTT